MDEIDRRKAKHFAWRVLGPAELTSALDLSSASEEEDDEQDEDEPSEPEVAVEPSEKQQSLESFRAQARRDCRALAKHVDAVWALEESLQAQQMPALVAHVDKIGLEIGALESSATLKLARLWVRHWDGLASKHRKPVFLLPMAWFDHPDLPVLLGEIAARGNSRMAFVMEHAIGEEDVEFPGLGQQLGRIIEAPVRPEAARIALRWLVWCEASEARKWLRSAMRLPHLPRRVEALCAARARTGEVLLGEDVLWLLEDAVVHPLPYDHGYGSHEDAYCYSNALSAAVAALRPAGGEKPLIQIVTGECSYYKRDRWHLDPAWALEALASAYPEASLPYIDEWLASPRWADRLTAVRAAARLSPNEARPRLLRVAGDGAHEIYTEVRTHWTRLFGEECPVPETAGLDRTLCSACGEDEPVPPRLLERLAIVRGNERTELLALVETLLAPRTDEANAEEEDGEALALLLMALEGGFLMHGGGALPNRRTGWVTLLARRFGPRAIEAIVHRASRERLRWYDSWGYALQSAQREGALDEAGLALLRKLMVAFLRTGQFERQELLSVLASIGAPPEQVARCFDWMLAGQIRGSENYWIQKILSQQEPDEDMRVRLRARLDEACSALEGATIERLAPVAALWKDGPSLDRLAAALDALGTDVRVPSWTLTAGRALFDTDRLDAAWREDRLAQPERTIFAVAAEFVRKEMTPLERERLIAALDSPAREGAAAAEAAVPVLAFLPEALTDARLREIAFAAPALQQAGLANPLLLRETWPSWLHGLVANLLAMPDEEVQDAIIDVVWCAARREEADAMLREGIERQPDLALRDHLCRVLRVPSSVERYWLQDEGDEEEDEDLDFDEDEDEERFD